MLRFLCHPRGVPGTRHPEQPSNVPGTTGKPGYAHPTLAALADGIASQMDLDLGGGSSAARHSSGT
jgi:hypothetical protein